MVRSSDATARKAPRRLTDAQRELAGRREHVDWAHALADRIATRHGRPSDDYRASALYGLIRAARRYRPERGPFLTFAASHVRGAILDDIREELGGGLRGALARSAVRADRGGVFLRVLRVEEQPVGWELESEDAVQARCRALPPKMGAVLSAYLLRADLAKIAAVAAAVGVSEGQVSRLIDGAAKRRNDSRQKRTHQRPKECGADVQCSAPDIARCERIGQSIRPTFPEHKERVMRVKKLRKLTLGEWSALELLADQIEREVDGTLADLVRRVARGDDTALVPAADRLIEIGRPNDAERLKKLLK